MSETRKVYFPGLNGLRFLAAFSVLISHTEQSKLLWNHANFFENKTVNTGGTLAVTFFFVLSGFLISYLLLVEKETTDKISIKSFYIRRILRIWPLYFIIVFLGFFILPEISVFKVPGVTEQLYEDFWIKLALFVFILPNVAKILYPTVWYSHQSWSIGVEEQFYLFWPIVFKFTKKYLLTLLIVVITMFFFRNFFAFLNNYTRGTEDNNLFLILNEVFIINRFNCMAIGGVFAFLFYNNNSVLKILFNLWTQILVYLLALGGIIMGVYVPYIHHDFYSTLFAIIILNIGCNPKSLISLKSKTWDSLGKISYGIYMYHLIGIRLSLFLIADLLIDPLLGNLALYSLASAITIFISFISYRLIEMPILKYKHYFTKVVSGEDARNG